MDFALDDTQRAISRLARATLARESDVDATWKALGEAGLLSLALPERLDGDELGVVEIAVLLTEIGRASSAVPALATLALGVLPVVRRGTAEQQDDLLAGIASGDRVLTAGLRGTVSAGNTRPGTRPGTLSGTLVGVPYGAKAYRILVPAADDVYVVDPAADGVTLTRTPTSSGTPEYTVALDGVAAPLLGEPGAAPELHRLALACACALGDGLVAGALDLTAEHVRTREQFGKPLATFQAVAQQIADVYVAARTLHLAALAACSRLTDTDVDVAAYWLTEEAPAAMHTCHHLHGGLGVDASYPLHRYSAATKDLVRLVGGGEHRLARLGARIAG
jgi:alkylation response protein AidB-like acyl-CoA dehydrogenase